MKRHKLFHYFVFLGLCFLIFALTSCMITYRVTQWNLLVYMSADNDLEPYGIENFNEMEFGLPAPYVNVFVLFDRAPGYDSSNGDWTTTRLYKVNWDLDANKINSQLIEDYGELDMTDPATLRDFIITVDLLSPADHTILTLWGHGAGVYPRNVAANGTSASSSSIDFSDPLTRGICPDWTTSSTSYLTTANVQSALYNARQVTGKKIDIINMDACSMQMLEIAYEWRNEADFLAGSEAYSPATGNNYIGILQSLKSAPISARDEAIAIVDSWYAWYSTTAYDRTYSVLSLTGNGFTQLITDFTTFATLLNAITDPTNRAEVRASRTATTSFLSSASPLGFMDLYSFAEQLVNNVTGDPAVTNAAASIMADINAIVIRNVATNNYFGTAHGISILLPVNSSDWSTFITPPAQYTNFQLSVDTDWNDFIAKFVNW